MKLISGKVSLILVFRSFMDKSERVDDSASLTDTAMRSPVTGLPIGKGTGEKAETATREESRMGKAVIFILAICVGWWSYRKF